MINVTEYLDKFPLMVSEEGFFDSITGKSKPKPDLDTNNIHDVIRKTYKSDDWLARFKTPAGKVNVKYGNFVTIDPAAGWRDEQAAKSRLQKSLFAELKKLTDLCDRYGKYLETADPTKTAESHTAAKRLETDINQLARRWNWEEPAAKVELPPVPKDKISKMADFVLTTKAANDDDSLYQAVQDAITPYLEKWHSADSKYRVMASKLENKPGVDSDAFSSIAVKLSGALEMFSNNVPEDSLRLSRRTYAESLIRYINASLA